MKVIVIPDKFKGTLTAKQAGEIISKGIISVMPFCSVLRLTAADGGDGTVDAYLDNVGGKKLYAKVKGPNGQEINAPFALLEDGTAVIEMATASGLILAAEGSSPLYTDTYGTGQLIKAALDAGCRRIIIGIGGSATNDGGVGMASALGVRFLDKAGRSIAPTGAGLYALDSIDMSGLDRRLDGMEVLVACDVDNPLCGPTGAAEVFSRQKGASEAAVKILDRNLRHLAEVVKRDLGMDMLSVPGGGAAGGLGGGLLIFLNAILTPGADLLLDACNFETHAEDADLIITGEGCFDSQSLHGKLPTAIAARARGKRVAIIGGCIRLTEKEAEDAGFFCVEQSAPDGLTMDQIKARCESDLFAAAERVARRML